MSYTTKPLACDPAALAGLSEKIVVSHYENNYGGAVKRLNAISQQLAELDWANAPVFVVNGLKREELIAANSMILHELYFESLGATAASAALLAQFERDFGGLERWAAQYAAMGRAQGGGSGWVLLAWSARDQKLVNTWAADHSGNLAGATPILALDMYEHSYHMDYGSAAAKYVEACMNNLNLAAASNKLAALTSGD